MIITKTTQIVITPSIPEEYLWWIEHREEMKKEGYVLHEDNSASFMAILSKIQGFDLRREK